MSRGDSEPFPSPLLPALCVGIKKAPYHLAGAVVVRGVLLIGACYAPVQVRDPLRPFDVLA